MLYACHNIKKSYCIANQWAPSHHKRLLIDTLEAEITGSFNLRLNVLLLFEIKTFRRGRGINHLYHSLEVSRVIVSSNKCIEWHV